MRRLPALLIGALVFPLVQVWKILGLVPAQAAIWRALAGLDMLRRRSLPHWIDVQDVFGFLRL